MRPNRSDLQVEETPAGKCSGVGEVSGVECRGGTRWCLALARATGDQGGPARRGSTPTAWVRHAGLASRRLEPQDPPERRGFLAVQEKVERGELVEVGAIGGEEWQRPKSAGGEEGRRRRRRSRDRKSVV